MLLPIPNTGQKPVTNLMLGKTGYYWYPNYRYCHSACMCSAC